MRIRTDGDYAHRKDVIEDAADFWGVNKTDAVVKSCDLAGRLVPQLENALAEADIPPSEAEKIAEKVSIRNINVEFQRATASVCETE
ncbi:hypothetical protein GCM10009037_06810 [Halarchaeum grantii]|uniref:DUF7692 domain-containing protein n=1 Tax=Halarchaeum grantii TaxID=1193105 RepID=A0A830F762_9EURY|nr:hypothetical protein [Halarchaeum grantii]GGL25823.1 hypothetical protein GCM10009037_06810 [Halarchaeum grantii]